MVTSRDSLPTGVVITASGKYGARYKHNGQAKWVGTYDTIDQAVDARKAAMAEVGAKEMIGSRPTNYHDLTGQVFGHLTVINDTGKRSGSSVVWHCQCDCGNVVNVSSKDLVTGHASSCGHVARDKMRKKQLERKRDYPGTNPDRLNNRPPSNSTTGQRGVSVKHNKNGEAYVVYVGYKGVKHYGGYFTNLDDAIEARDKLRDKLWSKTLDEFNGGQQKDRP